MRLIHIEGKILGEPGTIGGRRPVRGRRADGPRLADRSRSADRSWYGSAGFGCAALLLALALLLPTTLPAQTTTSGGLTGLVTGLDGAPLDGVDITLTRVGEGSERTLTATREGAFRATYLPPGEYELVAERFGFVPVHVRGVTVRSGRRATLTLRLRETEPPVTEIDQVTFAEVGSERATGTARTLSRSTLQRSPLDSPELARVLDRWSLAAGGGGLEVGGLPGWRTGLQVDGLRHDLVAHPRLGPDALYMGSLSPLFVEEVELAPQSLDVESGSLVGGGLRATTVRGGNNLEVDAMGNVFGTPMGGSDLFGRSVDRELVPEGSILVRGPIMRDTAHFALGVEARQAARTLTPLASSSMDDRNAFLELIGDGDRPADQRLGPTRIDRWDMLSTFGRLDWNLSQNHTMTIRSNVSVSRPGGEAEGAAVSFRPPEGSEASEVMVAASLFSILGERTALEIRVGGESSSREYGGSSGPGAGLDGRTWIQEGGILAGSEPGVPGRFEQSAFRFAPTLHIAARNHTFKFGVEAAGRRYEEESLIGPSLSLGFPNLAAFQSGQGVTERRDGPQRAVEVNSASAGVFVQDRWTPVESLALTVGLRADGEALPLQEILPSQLLTEQTGLTRVRSGEEPRGTVSPRGSIEWVPADGWRAEASAALYHDRVHPALLAEVMADTGAVRTRRTMGTVPGASGDAPFTFEAGRISLLGPRFDAPRTQRVDASLAYSLPVGTTLEVEVGQRRTDFLPRRRDLNRVPGAYAQDQFGRTLYGVVTQQDGVISVRPGSDRRFSDFDVISALESDGWSTWTGVTLGVRHEGAGPLTLDAAYTYSETRDNMPGAAAGWPGLVEGRPGTTGAGPGWVEGRSDLDVPHRATAYGELEVLEQPALRIGALYGFRSGTPFTPVVRDLLHGPAPLSVAAGSPISIPSGAQGLGEITSEWACVGALVGAERGRNTCRTDGIHDLNLRLGMDLATGTGWSLRLNVDALNLMDSGVEIPDPAVFVVDGSGSLPAVSGGQLELPVRVNPNFGEPLARLSPGRSLRIGIGVRY